MGNSIMKLYCPIYFKLSSEENDTCYRYEMDVKCAINESYNATNAWNIYKWLRIILTFDFRAYGCVHACCARFRID